MAERRPVIIDGRIDLVSSDARVSDVVGPEVESISTSDGEIFTRDQFRNLPVPAGFERQLQRVQKG